MPGSGWIHWAGLRRMHEKSFKAEEMRQCCLRHLQACPGPRVSQQQCHMHCSPLAGTLQMSASSESSPGTCLSSLSRRTEKQELTPALIYLFRQGKTEPGVVLRAAFIRGILYEHQQIFLGSLLFGRTKRWERPLHFSIFQ